MDGRGASFPLTPNTIKPTRDIVVSETLLLQNNSQHQLQPPPLHESFRSQPLSATLSHLESLLHLTGITRLSNITGLDDIGIPVWQAIRPDSKFLCVAQGKGLNPTQAKVSAIMESLELYHLESDHLPKIVCSYDARDKQHFHLNPEHIHHGCFMHPNLSEQPLDWVSSTHLMDQSPMWIPHAAIAMNMTLQTPQAHYFRQTTTGIAGGNTATEACTKALLEVIERHTLTQWKHDQNILAKRIQLNDQHPQIDYVLSAITQQNKSVTLYRISNTWNIPVYFCEIIDNNLTRSIGTCIGSGCHLDDAQAIIAALLEAIQTRLTIISGSRDDNYSTSYQQRYVNTPISLQAPRQTLSHEELISQETTSEKALQQLINTLTHHGTSDIYCIDHTHEKLNIPMMQVIIPSLGWL